LEPRRGKGNVEGMSKPVPDFAPWLGVFETLRVIEGRPLFAAEHRAELGRAMGALGIKTQANFDKARAGLPPLSGRWRWIVTPEETWTLFTEEEAATVEPLTLSISPVRVGSQNWDARFKTVSYLTHAQAAKTAKTDDVVLLNEGGDIASAARGNIFWRKGDRLFTPAHEAGCRCGVVRAFVLAQRKVKTGHFSLGDLAEADEIFVTSSIKGIVSVKSFQRRALKTFPFADELRAAYAEAIADQLKNQPPL
jgi:branched-subunit amino acid aminotransferase/4-amino-4-deoxychorismate lyase